MERRSKSKEIVKKISQNFNGLIPNLFESIV